VPKECAYSAAVVAAFPEVEPDPVIIVIIILELSHLELAALMVKEAQFLHMEILTAVPEAVTSPRVPTGTI